MYKEENVLGQKFLVDIISKVDTREAGKTDELALSVSYGDICRCVKKEMTKQNDKLLERVAERLASFIYSSLSPRFEPTPMYSFTISTDK